MVSVAQNSLAVSLEADGNPKLKGFKMTFKTKFDLVLSEKVELANGRKEHKEVGKAQIPTPVLADFGITADQAKKEDGTLEFDNGVPVYADAKWDWLQQAIVFRIAAKARNKFAKGTLKQGASLDEDFESLTAETQRTGEALALRREAKQSFEAYLLAQNKKQATITLLGELFANSAKVLASAGEKYVEALGKYVEQWIDQLPEDKKARFTPKLTELQESINNAAEATTVDDL